MYNVNMNSAALTGHRPERMGLSSITLNISPAWRKIIDWMKNTLVRNDITEAYCGMADGCDIAYGIAVKELKEEGYSIKLHCVLPCKGYEKGNVWYENLRDIADSWIELSEEFFKGCDDIRDQYMVDHSSNLLAVWDGIGSGGVYSTIQKAKKQDKNIIYYTEIMRDNLF